MAKAGTITLDGSEYTVHALNIGELERVTDTFITMPPQKIGFQILRIAAERMTPKLNIDTVEATTDEIAAAVAKIMEVSGFKAPPGAAPPNPPKAPGEG